MKPLIVCFLLLLVLFPSANLQVFDGLPLSSWPEFLALAFIVSFFLFPRLRQSADDLFRRFRFLPAAFWTAGAAALALKIVLLLSGAREGFTGCYRSPAAWADTAGNQAAPADCERSYEDLFRRSGGTRLDPAIRFGKDVWNLVFLNTGRYDYYDWLPGNIPRDRIPLAARWTGAVDIPAGSRLRIQYAGEGTLNLGGRAFVLPPFYDTVGQITVDADAGRQDLALAYLFDDGSRTGSDADLGPRAQIQVLLAGPMGEEALRPAGPEPVWIVLAALADVLFGVCLLSLISVLLAELRPDWPVLAAFAVFAAAGVLLPVPAWAKEVAVTAGLIAVWLWHLLRRPLRPVALYLVAGMAGLAITRCWLPSIQQVMMRSAGNDPLGTESQSYAVLATGSLEGGEAVFYAQPMFRYVRFLEHALFGDGDAPAAGAALVLFFGAAFFLFEPAVRRRRPLRERLVLALAGACVLLLGGYYVSAVIRDGLPEYVTWSLLFLALPLVFLTDSTASIACGFAALAFSFTVRANQLPAVAWILLWAGLRLWRTNRRALGIGLAAAVCIGLLPLAHNLYFGHAFVLTTTSAGTPSNLTLPPAAWLAFFQGDPAAAAAVREQAGMLFLISDLPRSQWPTLAAMLALLATWAAFGLLHVLRKARAEWPVAVLPAMYLAPHFFYVVNTYYPRHIVIAYLAMAAAVFIVFARPEPAAEGRSAPSAVKSN